MAMIEVGNGKDPAHGPILPTVPDARKVTDLADESRQVHTVDLRRSCVDAAIETPVRPLRRGSPAGPLRSDKDNGQHGRPARGPEFLLRRDPSRLFS
ncbi:hypothetical protein [Micromonospora sp. BL1]|uniref:hypothetical protein n=1 Tax=Micromonospora sp. BL1 TaxID=2478709 RepID=UPI0011C4920B|nr:hypothetical protein [Micromonospora sp. BL1]NED55384.1 hypothetical protein [Micromonospora aurantiaca]